MDNRLNLVVDFQGQGKLGGFLKNIIGLGKKGGGVLRDMKREAKKLDRELADVRQELAGASGNVTKLAQRERELEAAIAGANKQMAAQKRSLAQIAKAEKIQARGRTLRQSGRDNIVGGAGLLAPLVLAGKAASEFSDGMIDIQQKADLTAGDTAKIRNDIIAAAKATKQMPENLRAGVDTLIGAGLDAKIATQMIAPIGKAATAYRAEVDDLAKTSFSNFQNLKVPIGDTTKAINIMAQAGKEGNFEINEMALHFPALTAQAQTLGQTGVEAVADLSAALQIARRGAGDSATAATNVQNLLTAINTERTIKKFQKFGIDLPAAMRKAAAEGKTPLEAIAMLTKKATGGDLSKIPLLVGSQQAQKALAPLINDFDDYLAIRDKAAGADGVFDKDFNLRAKGAATNTRAAMASLSRLALVAGTHLLPVFTRIVDKVTMFIDQAAAWAQANPKTAKTLLMVVAGLGAFKIALGTAQFAFGGFLSAAGGLWKFFSVTNLAGVSRAARLFGVLRTATLFLAKGVMKAGLIMLANPVVAAIVAIVAILGFAGYMIYKHWDTIKAAFWTAIDWMKTLPARFKGFGSAMINGLVNGITSAPGRVWNALKKVVSSGLDRVKSFLGIRSPSRVFMGIGGFMTEGMAIGVDRGGRRPIDSLKRMSRQLVAAGSAAALSPVVAQAATSGGTGSAASLSQSSGGLTFNIYQQPGEDGEALARRIISIMKREKEIDRRSDFEDEF